MPTGLWDQLRSDLLQRGSASVMVWKHTWGGIADQMTAQRQPIWWRTGH
jgi:hypothetical protein